MNSSLLFPLFRKNRNSIYCLLGSISIDPGLTELDIFLVKPEGLKNRLQNLVKKYDKIFTAFSFATPQVPSLLSTIRKLKTDFGNKLFLIAGGPHPSGVPKTTLEMGFDILVIGEGEKTFPKLLKLLINEKPYTHLEGIAYKQNSKIHLNIKPQPINLDDFPPFSKNFGFMPLEITRGCPFACNYCQVSFLFGKTPRHRSVNEIIKFAKYLLRCREPWDFRFISPNAFGYGSPDGILPKANRVKDLLCSLRELYGEKRIYFGTFPSECRPEFVNEEMVDLVCRFADNDNLIIGGQSGSDEVLDYIHRGHSVSDIFRAVQTSLDSGLKVNVDFIIGFPNETEEERETTVSLMKELIEMNVKIHLHYFLPLPGTPFWNKVPTPLDYKTRRILGRWTKEKKLYGRWSSQELTSQDRF